MIPKYVQRIHEKQGLLISGKIGAKAKQGHCAHCGLSVLAGLQDGYGWRIAIVDLGHLTSLGELWATLAGLRTYAHQIWSDGRLGYRDADSIATFPADGSRVPVLVEHRCGATPPPCKPPKPRPTDHDTPPF